MIAVRTQLVRDDVLAVGRVSARAPGLLSATMAEPPGSRGSGNHFIEVTADEANLVEIRHTLRQLVNVKGD